MIHIRTLCILSLLAGLPLIAAPPVSAQSAKACKRACKNGKKACLKGIKEDFKETKAACKRDFTGRERKTCIKNAKNAGKPLKKLCKKGSATSFKECKTCCGGDNTAGCFVEVCGDQEIGPTEGCDDGVNDNSDTAPNACRTNCDRAGCGDGVTDTGLGEECDPPSSGTCDLNCRLSVLTTMTTTTTPASSTSTIPGSSTTNTTATFTSSTTSTTTTTTSTTTTTLDPTICHDPSRTQADTVKRCREFDEDPDACAMAWAITSCAFGRPQCMGQPVMAVSCHYDPVTRTCEGCGPNNEGKCVNTCAEPP